MRQEHKEASRQAASHMIFDRMRHSLIIPVETSAADMTLDHPKSSASPPRDEAAPACPLPVAIEALIGATRRFIDTHAPQFVAGASVPWSDPLQRRTVPTSSLPVLRHLSLCQTAAPPAMHPLVEALHSAAPVLPWRQTYGARQMSQHFLTQYGWAELVGLTGPVPSRTCAVGFLLLGPDVEYPPHHHEALELYLPLAGRAAWWRAQSGWQQIEPGEPVLHARWEAHAMRTESEPLLALYLWRSEHLDQHAELTDRRALEG